MNNTNRKDDNLLAVEPNTTTPSVNAAVTAKPVVESNDIENLDVNVGDSRLWALRLGRPEKGKYMRFAFLPVQVAGDWKSAKSHYIAGRGIYRCLSQDVGRAYCCTVTGQVGRLHVVAPVIRYVDADPHTGKLEQNKPIAWELRYVDMTEYSQRWILGFTDEEQSVYDFDFVMWHEDGGLGYEFDRISPQARWTLDPQVKAGVEEAAKRMFLRDGGEQLASRLGKVATLQEWKTLPVSAADGAETAVFADFVDDEHYMYLFTRCLNGCCGSGRPVERLELMGFAEGKPLITSDYCSERCYREVQGEYCGGILGEFMERLGEFGDDMEFYVVYDQPNGWHHHLPATFQPGIVGLASRGYRPVGVFGIDNKGNLLDQQCFYPTRDGDEAIISDEVAEFAKRRHEDGNGNASLEGIEDLN
jgi:hypothetical protein